ncbi:MAG: hypothetical protein R6V23_12255 [Bacteroidales bacterium]
MKARVKNIPTCISLLKLHKTFYFISEIITIIWRVGPDKRRAMRWSELSLDRNSYDGACPTAVYYFIQRQEWVEASFVLDFSLVRFFSSKEKK